MEARWVHLARELSALEDAQSRQRRLRAPRVLRALHPRDQVRMVAALAQLHLQIVEGGPREDEEGMRRG
jgi:hypothetical protein